MQRAIVAAVMLVTLAWSETSLAAPDSQRHAPAARSDASGEKVTALPPAGPVSQASDGGDSLCRLIDAAAARNGLPSGFFTRLIWAESSFRPGVVSPKGAQGIAQFMPATAAERGLADAFDPRQAIPASASLLKDLAERFGNIGLAAAAYNAGPARVAAWLSGTGGMPGETRVYVAAVTGRAVENWRAGQVSAGQDDAGQDKDAAPCQEVVASLTDPAALPRSPRESATAHPPWGVQLAGNFSEARALARYRDLQTQYPQVLGDKEAIVLRKRNAGRGTKPMIHVRVPARTRSAAEDLCRRLRARGGACVVLKN